MAKEPQIRGMLLEEAILFLLQNSGYRTVSYDHEDPTLHNGHSGLELRGRGALHQIDAIADFTVQQPFSNPQRLLVEGKCLDSNKLVGLPIIRNGYGVLRDVCEFWASQRDGRGDGPRRSTRYHYQYAIFSATTFTKPAQDYAYAHDIYLLPLSNTYGLSRLIDAIRGAAITIGEIDRHEFKDLRDAIRYAIAVEEGELGEEAQQVSTHTETRYNGLGPITNECHRLRNSLLAVMGGRFPVFLVRNPDAPPQPTHQQLRVRITWDEHGWYITDTQGAVLYSFDLPHELFRLYADDGLFTKRQAVELKQDALSRFHAVQILNGQPSIIEFLLDGDWLETVRRGLDELPN